ncbi:MAG: hypothetical protein WD009_13055 [Phycisphaeraceae bacterium]
MAEQPHRYVVCLTDRSDDLSVMKGKLYRVVEPDPSDAPTDIRIIDEAGEDYPYPREWFVALDLPQQVIEALDAA